MRRTYAIWRMWICRMWGCCWGILWRSRRLIRHRTGIWKALWHKSAKLTLKKEDSSWSTYTKWCLARITTGLNSCTNRLTKLILKRSLMKPSQSNNTPRHSILKQIRYKSGAKRWIPFLNLQSMRPTISNPGNYVNLTTTQRWGQVKTCILPNAASSKNLWRFRKSNRCCLCRYLYREAGRIYMQQGRGERS